MKPRRKYTVSQAKNLMQRAVAEIVDPGPRSIDQLWEFFDSRCAYYGRVLERGLREGHVDHAEPDGGNHIGNLVLACGACNGDEKRDMSWREFLGQKSRDPATCREREARILTSSALHARSPTRDSAEVVRVRAEISERIDTFGVKCSELKRALQRTADDDG